MAFSALEVLLHQEAILNLMQFGQTLQAAIAPPGAPAKPVVAAPATAPVVSVSGTEVVAETPGAVKIGELRN